MKKVFLFSIMLVLVNSSFSQIILNEVFPDSKAGQFVELYNTSSSSENLDCYTLITHIKYTTGKGVSAVDYEGFYVLNFDNSQSLNPNGRFVIDKNNWSSVSRVGSLKKYYKQVGAASYSVVDESTSTSVTEIMSDANSGANFTLLLKESAVSDVLVIKDDLANAVIYVNSFANLPSLVGACSASPININFTDIANQLTNKNIANALGSGNSASRVCDGLCYGWIKETSITKNSSNCTSVPTSGPELNKIYDPPIWTITSLRYDKDAIGDKLGNLLQSPAIPDGAFATDETAKTFDVYITAQTINADAQGLMVNILVFPDRNNDQVADDPQEIQIVPFTLSPTLNGTAEKYFKINLPAVPFEGKFITKIVTTPGFCSNSTLNSFTNAALAGQLPVTFGKVFLKFSNKQILTSWSTLTEQNNKGFEIQRSIGKTNDFKTIGFVGTRAKDGNSQTEISYSFEDADVKAGQTHYYRLNQIDFDGKSAFSPVKSIKPGSIESNLNVYPNPSQGSFTVNTGSNSGKLNIFVMDNTGRVVNQFMNVSTSNTRINNLKKGFYTLKIVNTESGEQSAQRVVVQ